MFTLAQVRKVRVFSDFRQGGSVMSLEGSNSSVTDMGAPSSTLVKGVTGEVQKVLESMFSLSARTALAAFAHFVKGRYGVGQKEIEREFRTHILRIFSLLEERQKEAFGSLYRRGGISYSGEESHFLDQMIDALIVQDSSFQRFLVERSPVYR